MGHWFEKDLTFFLNNKIDEKSTQFWLVKINAIFKWFTAEEG